jgi:acyl-coenzyme A synthetase/AMP-(fatty) acid ligase
MIRGGSTARAYWNNPERTDSTMVDGWLDTGDTYVQDAEGYYVYFGRNDDLLKVSGQWCSPFEIEAKLSEHGAVLEAAVVGRADGDGLTKPEAWIVLKDKTADANAVEAELVALCKTGLAPHKYPRWFRFVADLPKTATGKIQRFRLRQG